MSFDVDMPAETLTLRSFDKLRNLNRLVRLLSNRRSVFPEMLGQSSFVVNVSMLLLVCLGGGGIHGIHDALLLMTDFELIIFACVGYDA